MKKLLATVLVLVIAISLTACAAQPKEFSESGMTITLTTAFFENTQGGYTVCYDSANVAVFVLKESFSLQAGVGDMSLDDYAALVRASNASKSPSAISKADGLTSMEYSFENTSENKTYKYFCTMFKGPDAFWLVQFATLEDKYDELLPTLKEYAKSVVFE